MAKHVDFYWWLRLPLVPIVFAVGCVFVAGLALLYVVCLPGLLLYPEWQPHEYDCGTQRQQEIARRWRAACRRVPLSRRLKRLVLHR